MLLGVQNSVVGCRDRACPVHKDPIFSTDEAGLVPTHHDFTGHKGSPRYHVLLPACCAQNRSFQARATQRVAPTNPYLNLGLYFYDFGAPTSPHT